MSDVESSLRTVDYLMEQGIQESVDAILADRIVVANEALP